MSGTEIIAEDYNECQGNPAAAAMTEYADVVYPESDGKPMGETEFHVTAILHLMEVLRYYFKEKEDIYVIADMFLYYRKGNPRAQKAPDVMVIKGVEKKKRRIFKIWEEGEAPCVIFEVTSESTKDEDMVNKKELYASLNVKEYFLFDPLGEYLKQNFLGFRLRKNRMYVPVPADRKGRIFSRELGVYLKPEDDLLRVIDPDTDMPVPDHKEAMMTADSERKKADSERKKAESERKKAEKLAAKLRELGIEPDEL